jgi:hypothetical protein
VKFHRNMHSHLVVEEDDDAHSVASSTASVQTTALLNADYGNLRELTKIKRPDRSDRAPRVQLLNPIRESPRSRSASPTHHKHFAENKENLQLPPIIFPNSPDQQPSVKDLASPSVPENEDLEESNSCFDRLAEHIRMPTKYCVSRCVSCRLNFGFVLERSLC